MRAELLQRMIDALPDGRNYPVGFVWKFPFLELGDRDLWSNAQKSPSPEDGPTIDWGWTGNEWFYLNSNTPLPSSIALFEYRKTVGLDFNNMPETEYRVHVSIPGLPVFSAIRTVSTNLDHNVIYDGSFKSSMIRLLGENIAQQIVHELADNESRTV